MVDSKHNDSVGNYDEMTGNHIMNVIAFTKMNSKREVIAINDNNSDSNYDVITGNHDARSSNYVGIICNHAIGTINYKVITSLRCMKMSNHCVVGGGKIAVGGIQLKYYGYYLWVYSKQVCAMGGSSLTVTIPHLQD